MTLEEVNRIFQDMSLEEQDDFWRDIEAKKEER